MSGQYCSKHSFAIWFAIEICSCDIQFKDGLQETQQKLKVLPLHQSLTYYNRPNEQGATTEFLVNLAVRIKHAP